MGEDKKLKESLLHKMTKSELLDLAKKQGLKLKETILKADLIGLLTKNSSPGKPEVKSEAKTAKETRRTTTEKSITNPPPNVETSEALIEVSKFYEGPNVQPQQLEANALPATYNRNVLVMMARDPYWCYTYWDLTPDHVESSRQKLRDSSSARMVLRIYDITGLDFNGLNARRQWDIDLVGYCNNWYVHLGVSDCDYLAEIGWIDRFGNFVALARSNNVHTPRDRMSDVIDEEWLTVEEDFQKLYHLSGGMTYNRSSGEITELLAKRWRFDISSGGVSSFVSGKHPVNRPKS